VTLANQWSHEAIAAIDPLPDGAVKDALTRFARAVADRSS
jgi:heptaprenyl diphosphate synthase